MEARPTPLYLGIFSALAFLVLSAGATSAQAQALPGGSLNPTTIPQFVEPLTIPPVMPPAGLRYDHKARKLIPYYEIEVVQFQQQILPSTDSMENPTGLPQTTVWSYGAVGRPETRNYPAFTIENLEGLPTRIKWVNNLKDPNTGDFLPHLLPVDQSLHWANPEMLPCMHHSGMIMPHPMPMTDCRPMDPPQGPYAGPVPIVTHVHGAHVQPDSDGYPEAWTLPNAGNIPDGYAMRGKRYGQIPGAPDEPGAALFQYPNNQPETTLWYHDHTLGMTRTNVYAGPAGFFLIRDPKNIGLRLPGPAPLPGIDPNGNPIARRLVREIPIVIQDRSFNTDGSLFYPDNRDFFEGLDPGTLSGLGIRFTPEDMSDVAPIWNPEFFGNTMVVNGKTWPKLEVEQRKYRFRLLNGSDSRFLILRFEDEALTFHQIGGDQGFLPTPVQQRRLLLGPAERADVIVDFSTLAPRSRIVLQNIGPDEPFGGGATCLTAGSLPGDGTCEFLPADPLTTGVVMAFDVVRRRLPDLSRIPAALPAEGPLPGSTVTRKLSLNEEMSMSQLACFDAEGNLITVPGSANDDAACTAAGGTLDHFGPTAAKLGTLEGGIGIPKMWEEAITENPALNAVETWEIYNFTADAHPIHLHLVRFKVLEREKLATYDDGIAMQPAELTGISRLPEAWEAGYKDTVIAYPGEVTRISAKFDIEGLYVWHCHILEHEDNEMMRPYFVGDPSKSPIPVEPPTP